MKSNIVKIAALNAAVATLYVAAVASLLFYSSKLFGRANTVLIPIAMLLLLVCSAAFVGWMIFGRPVMWYLDGKKKEALSLLGWTLGILFVITFIAFFGLVAYFPR